MTRVLLCIALALAACGGTEPESIVLASTTSTENSGLFAHILPQFTRATGIDVRVVAVGTGQAIRNAEKGDADVLLVHHRPSEDRFVAAGYGVNRKDVMYNDFVIVGPAQDPAGITASKDALDALRRIATAAAPFVSRGDESGTHKKEEALWRDAGRAPAGRWYRSVGAGMGAALNIAAGMGAYTLADRATWLSFKNKRGLKLLYAGDKRLFNPYGVIAVNPARHPHVNAKAAARFVEWLTSSEGQAAIAEFRIDGAQVFFPSAPA